MGNFGRDDRSSGGFRGGFRGGDRGGRGGFGGGRSSFGGGRSFDRGGDRGNREMFKTTCSNCGKECEVPFRPTNGKPVYCSECFEKMGNGGRSDSPRNDFRSPSPVSNQNNTQLDAVNAKLDRILAILEPKKVEEKKVVEEVVKEEKDPKAKKTVKKSTPVKE
jgi:CxxC-x17-CxxC domain-containing protein